MTKIYLSLTSSPSAPRIPLELPADTSSSTLRTMASEATSIPLSNMKLIFRGRMIADKSDNDVVTEFKLEEECVVHVMGKAVAQSNTTAPAAATQPAPAVAGASVTVPNNTATPSNPTLTSALTTLKLNPPPVYKTALSTASKLLSNIISNPMEEKYRSIKKSNAAFNKRLGGVSGGEQFLLAAGFTLEDGVFVLTPSEEAWPKLVEAGEVANRALAEAEASSAAPTPAGTGFGMSGGGVGAMPPMGMPGLGAGGMPSMEAMQNLLSNPEALQGMMNNPMVQQMMRSDPRLANNPMLQQSLEALQQNPDMLRQFSSMMNDPGLRDNINRMMQQQQQAGGAGGTSGGADPFAGGPEEMRRQMEQFAQMQQAFGGNSGQFNLQQQQQQQASQQPGTQQNGSTNNNATNSRSDDEMTEEEMIAEAIARSLRES